MRLRDAVDMLADSGRVAAPGVPARRKARRDRLLSFVLRHVVTEKSLAWIYEHHLDWQSGVAPGERAA